MLLSTLRAGWFDGLIALPIGPYFKVAELDAFYKRFREHRFAASRPRCRRFPASWSAERTERENRSIT